MNERSGKVITQCEQQKINEKLPKIFKKLEMPHKKQVDIKQVAVKDSKRPKDYCYQSALHAHLLTV